MKMNHTESQAHADAAREAEAGDPDQSDVRSHLIAAVMNAAASRLAPSVPVHPLPQFLGQHTNPARNAQRQLLKASKPGAHAPKANFAKDRMRKKHKPHQNGTLVGRAPLRRIGVDGKEVRRAWVAAE